MFGIRYVKSSPAQYLLQYRDGHIVREGTGLSFYYFAPRSTLVSIPLTANELPFMFEETTRDFQTVTLQGQVNYRVAEPRTLAAQLDFTLLPNGAYASEDPQRLPLRVLNAVRAEFRALLEERDLREVLQASAALAAAARGRLMAAPAIASLGLEIAGLGLQAIRPTPETARALEAAVREQILKEADDATYARRNAAIDQERSVKENELRSEMAVEQRRREVQQARLESERVLQDQRQQVQMDELAGKVELERRGSELVELEATNRRQEADVQAYRLKAITEALEGLDPRALQTLVLGQASPETLVALGFQNIADNAAKIGEVNIAPDLLRQLARKA